MALPEATALIRASNRKLAGDLRKSRRMFDKSFKKTGKNIKSSLRGALAPLGVGLGIAGIASIGKSVLDFEDKLSRLEIQSGASGQEMAKFRETVDALSKATGISRDEILSGAEALVNLQGAAGFNADTLKVLTEAQLATGTSMEDLAGLTFALGNAFGIATPEELTKGLSGIIEAGKQGAVPLNQMSSALQKLAVKFADFGVKTGPKAAAELAAALQITRKGFGSAEEAATGLQGLMVALLRNSEKLKKAGVEVFDIGPGGERTLRSISDITTDLKRFDQKKLVDLLGRVEASTAAQVLGKFGDELVDLTAKAVVSDAVQTDAEKRRQSNAFKIKKAFNDMKLALVKAFTPERIAKFASAMEQLATLIEFLVDNAEIFVAIWAAFKVGSLVSGFASMLTSLQGGGVASAGILKNLKGAALIGASFGAGFALGTFLDETFGISDAISDALVDTEARRTQIDTGLLQSQAKKLSFATRTATGEGGARELSRQERLAAAGITRQAREAGIIGEGGKLDVRRAFEVAEGKSLGGGIAGGLITEERLLESADTRELLAAIRFAQQQQLKQQLVGITITVDQNGMIRATENQENQTRRSTQ